MEKLITWLQTVEMLACDLYADVAEKYHDHPKLKQFLTQLSHDEARHYQLMATAGTFIAQQGIDPKSAIELDDELRTRVEKPLQTCRAEMESGALTPERVIEYIVDAEFSEWNHVFVYVIENLQGHSRVFQNAAALIQGHERRIRRFLEETERTEYLDRLDQLPTVWETKILVIDDDTSLRTLMHAMLCGKGEVQTAENGAIALDLVTNQFYDAILCDIDMPVMGGIEFFTKAIAETPDLRNHIVFWSGELTADRAEFLNSNNVPFLEKPAAMKDLEAQIDALIQHSHKAQN